MMTKILRAAGWGYLGAIVGYLVIGIVALWINTFRFTHNPSIDIEDASNRVAVAIGYAIGCAIGAVYGYTRSTAKKLHHGQAIQ